MKTKVGCAKRKLVIELSAAEARAIMGGIQELYKLRDGMGMFCWPNIAVANLSFAVTGFLNEEIKYNDKVL